MKDYQRRVWVNGEMPPSRDCLDDVMHFYYDDTDLSRAPEECIGWFLRDQSEADGARKVVNAFEAVCNEVGTSDFDADYVNASGWPRVVAAAKSLLETMNALDPAAGPPLRQ